MMVYPKLNIESLSKFKSTFWNKEIPCLHRVHLSEPSHGAHKIQNMIGMSISLERMENKLRILSKTIEETNKISHLNLKALLTFDDGHKDVLLAVKVLEKFPLIQPVLFLTGKQLHNDTTPLPLTALYSWCDSKKLDLNNLLPTYGFSRESLKKLPELEQQNILKSRGIDIKPLGEKMLNLKEVNSLVSKGWFVGYHGSSHCDLRIYSSEELVERFICDYKRLKELAFKPWIAWPEGRWNDSIAAMAFKIGFKNQFGLEGEQGVGTKTYCINRRIWN